MNVRESPTIPGTSRTTLHQPMPRLSIVGGRETAGPSKKRRSWRRPNSKSGLDIEYRGRVQANERHTFRRLYRHRLQRQLLFGLGRSLSPGVPRLRYTAWGWSTPSVEDEEVLADFRPPSCSGSAGPSSRGKRRLPLENFLDFHERLSRSAVSARLLLICSRLESLSTAESAWAASAPRRVEGVSSGRSGVGLSIARVSPDAFQSNSNCGSLRPRSSVESKWASGQGSSAAGSATADGVVATDEGRADRFRGGGSSSQRVYRRGLGDPCGSGSALVP